MDNRIYNIGDTLVITVKPKQKGTAIITSFEDSFIGLAEEKKIHRDYRIIEDDMFYTDWVELTNDTINGKELKQNNYIQVRYTRYGTDLSGYIEFQNIVFNGDFNPEVINSPILDNSIFADIAWSEETEALAKNLFKKLYYRGILPMYILRGDNRSVDEDKDFITLFYSVAKYFAIIIRFFKRFEKFYDDEKLMLEWLRQNEIQFDESTIKLTQLQFLARHLYDEIRKRGTTMIFKRQGDVVSDKEIEIDGEFIRLIRSKRSDELLYENIPFKKLGWCLGNSSPLYRGTGFSEKLNKTKESGEDFEDLNNFQTFSKSNSNLSIVQTDVKYLTAIVDSIYFDKVQRDLETLPEAKHQEPQVVSVISNSNVLDWRNDNELAMVRDNSFNWLTVGSDLKNGTTTIRAIESSKKVLLCKTSGNSACGLGRIDEDAEVSDRIYTADPNLDYEITFMFNPKLIGNAAKINFGVEAFDVMKNKLDDAFIMSNGERVTEMFMDGLPLSNFKENQWYFVRGIIHAYSSSFVENAKLNCGFGNNLTFDNKFVKYILPKIYLSSQNSSQMLLWNYKIRPLIRGTNILPLKSGFENSHSLGFVQAPQIFYAYFRNNNNSQSKAEITDIIERYLLPFNVTDILQFIDSE